MEWKTEKTKWICGKEQDGRGGEQDYEHDYDYENRSSFLIVFVFVILLAHSTH